MGRREEESLEADQEEFYGEKEWDRVKSTGKGGQEEGKLICDEEDIWTLNLMTREGKLRAERVEPRVGDEQQHGAASNENVPHLEKVYSNLRQPLNRMPEDKMEDSMNNNHISRAYVPHLEKVYSNLRQQLHRKPEDKMEDSEQQPHSAFDAAEQQPHISCLRSTSRASLLEFATAT